MVKEGSCFQEEPSLLYKPEFCRGKEYQNAISLIMQGSHEVKTVKADASAVVLTTLDTSYRACD
jgi:hypothetical protein